jgi:antitoxin MazE
MNSHFSKWGNSAALRIPTPLLGLAGFSAREAVSLRAEEGRIVIEKAKNTYDLDTMINALTPENSHSAVRHTHTVGAEEIEW